MPPWTATVVIALLAFDTGILVGFGVGFLAARSARVERLLRERNSGRGYGRN